MGYTEREWIAVNDYFKYFRAKGNDKYKNWINVTRISYVGEKDDDIVKVKDLTEEECVLELL